MSWWHKLTRTVINTACVGALKAHHPDPQWATFEEHRLGTCFGHNRETRIDFLAIHLWSKVRGGAPGPHVVAYEVKVDRADFLREIQDPEKRKPAEALATECYFCTPAGLVEHDEVPEGWGLVEVVKGNRVRTTKIATQREHKPWPWYAIQGLARRIHAHEAGPGRELKQELWRLQGIDLTEDEVRAVVREHYKWELERASKQGAEKAVKEWKQWSWEWRAYLGLSGVLRELGMSENPDELRSRLTQQMAMKPSMRSRLVELRHSLDRVLGEEG